MPNARMCDRLTLRSALLATIRPNGNFTMSATRPVSRTGRARYARLPMVAAPRLVPEAGYRATLRSVLVGPTVTPRLMRSPTILVFDSGVGGLSVFREIARARPDAHFLYAADDALFPYGRIAQEELVIRVTGLMEGLIETHRPDLVVVACNTASVQALPALRARFTLPFVGTVPAIKPACAASQSNRVAALAEAALAGEAVDDEAIFSEIDPCFVEDGNERTDTIVLACTHYPLLLDRFEHLAPWAVRWLDPAPAIARRVVDLIGPATAQKREGAALAVFTSGRSPSRALATALTSFG